MLMNQLTLPRSKRSGSQSFGDRVRSRHRLRQYTCHPPHGRTRLPKRPQSHPRYINQVEDEEYALEQYVDQANKRDCRVRPFLGFAGISASPVP
jgi:hypothetical protein